MNAKRHITIAMSILMTLSTLALASAQAEEPFYRGGLDGGGLILAATHKFKELGLPLPGALFAGTPWADLTKTGDSYFTNEGVDNVLVAYEGLLEGAAKLYAADHELTDPLISPVYGDFNAPPPPPPGRTWSAARGTCS